MTSRAEWTGAFAAALNVTDLSEEEVEALLGLAGEAAHASERTTAPLACWLAAKSGLSAQQALDVARGLRAGLGGAGAP